MKNTLFVGIGLAVFLIIFYIWNTGALNNYLPFFMTTDGWNTYEREINAPQAEGSTPALTEAEARSIAEQACIKGGDALASGGMYNPNSRTWWFDANLNGTREGCSPACVVSEDTKTAEINWRCTGLIVPDEN